LTLEGKCSLRQKMCHCFLGSLPIDFLSLRHSDLDKYVDIVTRENGRLLVSPKKELTSRHTEESVLTEYYLVKQE
jgi:hypothetical protein